MDALSLVKNIPPWLDQSLFEKAIRSYENDQSAQVYSFDIQPATQPGENFASAVFRVSIKYSSKYTKGEKEISVIIKTQPVGIDEMPGAEFLKDTTIFRTEIAMYTGVLSQIQSLLESVGENDLMCPKLIYQTLTPKPVIILEDVSLKGYGTMIKKLPDDFELTKRIIKRLSKYHAAAFYLESEQKIDSSQFNSSLYANKAIAETMFNETLEVFIEKVETWKGFEKFVEPLKNYRKNYMEKGLKSYTPSSGPFSLNVLNHGDFHLKNILYKINDEGEVEDFIFFDYQVAIYATPAVDLSYALYNFVSDDNRENRYDELLKVYHEQFVEALRKFGYIKAPPTLLDLQVEMMKNGNVQVLLGVCFYPFLLFDFSTLTAEDVTSGPKAFKAKIFESENFKEVMRRELPKFLHKGYLK